VATRGSEASDGLAAGSSRHSGPGFRLVTVASPSEAVLDYYELEGRRAASGRLLGLELGRLQLGMADTRRHPPVLVLVLVAWPSVLVVEPLGHGRSVSWGLASSPGRLRGRRAT
jgi:hypothetical protein